MRVHLDRFGTAPDGRPFSSVRSAMLSESSFGRIWRQAREKAFTAAQARSPLDPMTSVTAAYPAGDRALA
jgi:hypothetical protein